MAKKSKYETSTSRTQRIAIWTIALVMAVGTITTFIVVIVANNNPDANPQQIAYNKQVEEYKKRQEAQQKQQEELQKSYRALDGYEVTPFEASSVTELKVETLKEGDGEEVKEGATVTANYTGYLPDGTIFQSTKSEGSDAKPIPFELANVITGWKNGLVGTKVGGVYRLTIPSDQAYGANGSGTTIPANTPIGFIVEITAVKNS